MPPPKDPPEAPKGKAAVAGIAKLLLEALVEQLRIRKLELEERAREANRQKLEERAKPPNQENVESGRRNQRPGGGRQDRSRGRRNSRSPPGRGPGDGRRPPRSRSHDRVEPVSYDFGVSATPSDQHDNPDPRYMMTGGAGPPFPGPEDEDEHNELPNDQAEPTRRRRRRKRSPPLGPVPTYNPKLGLTLGFGTHYRNCLVYEVQSREKQARKEQRRERREERKKRKDGRGGKHELDGQDDGGPYGQGNSEDEGPHSPTGRPGQRPPRSNGPGASSPYQNVYEQNSHSHEVEDHEREQEEVAYEHDPHSAAVEGRESEQEQGQAQYHPHAGYPAQFPSIRVNSPGGSVYRPRSPVDEGDRGDADSIRPESSISVRHLPRENRDEGGQGARQEAGQGTRQAYPTHIIPPDAELQVVTERAPPAYTGVAGDMEESIWVDPE